MSEALQVRCWKRLPHQKGGVFAVRFDRTGRYCLTGGADRHVRLWNPSTGFLIQTYEGHSYQVLAIDAAKDGSRIASGGGDRSAYLWDVATATITRKFGGPFGHTQRINSIAFAGIGESVLVTASYDSTVRLWDCRANTSKPVQMLDDAEDSVSAVVVSDKTADIFTGSIDANLRTYDIRSGQIAADELPAPVVSLDVSKDGNCILAGCLGAGMWLLEKSSGESLCEYLGHDTGSFRFDCCVLCDDGMVASGSDDGSVCFWDIAEGSVPKIRIQDDEVSGIPVCSVTAHPTELIVLTGAHSGVVKLWSLTSR